MIPESQADKLLAPIYTNTRTWKPRSWPTPETSNSPCSAPNPTPQRPSSASTSWPTAWKRCSKTGSTPPIGESAESLEQIVLYYLGLRQATLAVAESCTGGMIAQRITSVPGSSRSFLGGAIVYSNELKTAFAGVSPGVDRELWRGFSGGRRSARLRHSPRTGATLGLGVTGIAGPTGGTEAKPVGLVYIAISDDQKTDVRRANLPRRPRAHPSVGRPASARPRAAKAAVETPSALVPFLRP